MFRQAAQKVARPVFRQQSRNMSGDYTRADGPMIRQQCVEWTRYTIPVVGVVGVWAIAEHFMHHEHHDHDPPMKPYQNYQAKAVPWAHPECTFFDPECHKMAKKEGKGVHRCF